MGNSAPLDTGEYQSVDLPPSASTFAVPPPSSLSVTSVSSSPELKEPPPKQSASAPVLTAKEPGAAKSTGGSGGGVYCPPVSRGLQNVGNSCYGNSVIQALFSTPGFAEALLGISTPAAAPRAATLSSSETLSSPLTAEAPLTSPYTVPAIDVSRVLRVPAEQSLLPDMVRLCSDLRMSRVGTIISPLSFFIKLREINALFRSLAHQDSHEFLIFLLNNLVESLEGPHSSGGLRKAPEPGKQPNLVEAHFLGHLAHETQCVACDTITSVEESFFNLSVDVLPNVSVSYCIRQFFTPELLAGQNKFFCNRCCHLQEAVKRVRVKDAPQHLIIHLKRFKFADKLQRLTKLSHRVYFGAELRLDDTPEHLYRLYAVVVHLGHGPNTGHYVCICKHADSPDWVLFDDHSSRPFQFEQMETIFGAALANHSSSCGYLLFYSRSSSG